MKHELSFSIDLIPIDVRIYTFLNKTPKNNYLFESFPLVQFLLIVLSVKVTYIRNECLAWVAYSQGRASNNSRAHQVIESRPSTLGYFFLLFLFRSLIPKLNKSCSRSLKRCQIATISKRPVHDGHQLDF